MDLGFGPTGAERRPRTRISTLREWLPIQLVDGARIAPTGLEPDISALKGLCPDQLDDGAIWVIRDLNPDLTD